MCYNYSAQVPLLLRAVPSGAWKPQLQSLHAAATSSNSTYKSFQKTEKERIFPNSLNEANTIQIPKPETQQGEEKKKPID